jgi:hypothetical protein
VIGNNWIQQLQREHKNFSVVKGIGFLGIIHGPGIFKHDVSENGLCLYIRKAFKKLQDHRYELVLVAVHMFQPKFMKQEQKIYNY